MNKDGEKVLILRKVLDCGSPLLLLYGKTAMPRRQKAAAVQDAVAFTVPTSFHA
jgi:hypothetical protein